MAIYSGINRPLKKARRFLARLASGTFLTGLRTGFSTACDAINRDLLLTVFFALALGAAAIGCGPGGSSPMPDSGFSVAFEEHNVSTEMVAGEKVSPMITVKNTSGVTWPSKPDYKNLNAVNLSYHWLDRRGRVVVFDGIRTPLPSDVPSGESVRLKATIQAPEREGRYILEITLVQEGVAWFPDREGEKLTVPVNVARAK